MKIALIGGTGFEKLEGANDEFHGIDTLFVHRHAGSTPPHRIDHKETFRYMKGQGVEAIVSISACGSLKKHLRPGDFALPGDYVDLTGRNATFIDDRIEHPQSLNPFNYGMRAAIDSALRKHYQEERIWPDGTVLSIRGPRFATLAESKLYATFADYINMTTGPEAALARELKIPYALILFITDRDSCCADAEELPTSYDVIKTRFEQGRAVLVNALPDALEAIRTGNLSVV